MALTLTDNSDAAQRVKQAKICAVRHSATHQLGLPRMPGDEGPLKGGVRKSQPQWVQR